MSKIVFKGGTVIDKSGERQADVLIGDDGKIAEISEGLSAEKTINIEGQIISSGLVDLNAHLSEPGDEEAETIETATRSAVKGGYTAVIAMPNTLIPNDTAETVRSLITLKENSLCHVEIAGAITTGNQGEEMAPITEMASLGVRHFSECISIEKNDPTIRRAMEYSHRLGVTLHFGLSGGALSENGQMNEGAISSQLGLKGIPKENEEIVVFRLCKLAEITGARVHLQQLSNTKSVEIVNKAQSEGVKVTCEVSPHHFALDETLIESFEGRYKVFPPLLTQNDVILMQRSIKERRIDAIATGHRAHENYLKELPFQQCPFGTIGFETALAAAITYLDIPLSEILNLLSWRPAEIAGLGNSHGGDLVSGRPGNLIVFDPSSTWIAKGSEMASKCSSSAFEGLEMKGLVSHTLVNGEVVVIGGELQK